VNRRRVLDGLVIDGQSGGHGVTLIDLSSKSEEPQLLAIGLSNGGTIYRS
jgi:hypothetical protein